LIKQSLDKEQVEMAWSRGISIDLSEAIDLAKKVSID
jgi:hypothetical protein